MADNHKDLPPMTSEELASAMGIPEEVVYDMVEDAEQEAEREADVEANTSPAATSEASTGTSTEVESIPMNSGAGSNIPLCPNCKTNHFVRLKFGWTNVYECFARTCSQTEPFMADGMYITRQRLAYISEQDAAESARLAAKQQAAEQTNPLNVTNPPKQQELGFVQGGDSRLDRSKMTKKQWKKHLKLLRQLEKGKGKTGLAVYKQPVQREVGGVRVGADGTVYCGTSDVLDHKCPERPKPVYVPRAMMDEWFNLAMRFDTEWMAWLQGKRDNDGSITITGMKFPPQTATPSMVDVPDGVRPPAGTIGAVHSHVSMSVFFSNTDIEHSNWDVEVVVNRRREWKMMVRHKLGCSRWAKSLSEELFLTGASTEESQLEKAFEKGAKLQEDKRRRLSAKQVADRFRLPEPRGNGSTGLVKIPPKGGSQQEQGLGRCSTCNHLRVSHGSQGCNETGQGGICSCRSPWGYNNYSTEWDHGVS